MTGGVAARSDPGRREWFLKEYQRNAVRLYLVAYGVLGNAEDAQDALQEAALRVYGKAHALDDSSSLEGYLVTATRNVSLDMLRGKGRLQRLADDPPAPPSDPGPGARLEGEEELQRLEAAFHQLPLAFQEVLFYRYREALDTKEIAGKLGISHDNARARLSRAHRMLRCELGEE